MESNILQQQMADLAKRYILLDRDYQPENIGFSLWVRRAADGYELMAVTLSGDSRDLLEALDSAFIRSAEAHVDRIYLQGLEKAQSEAISTYAHPQTSAWPTLTP